MATKLQITYLEGRLVIATQFVRELSALAGPSVRAYGGRRQLDIDINGYQGQKAAYQHLLKLTKADKF